MNKEPIKKVSQCERILNVLKDAQGQWVNGQTFGRGMMISQYHARIWQLQREGHNIEASKETDKYGFKLYRLRQEKSQSSLFNKVEEKDKTDRLMVMGY